MNWAYFYELYEPYGIYIKFYFIILQTDRDVPEVVRLCCVIKPLVTWHYERVASICRERCGGQGYLSVNRFGSFIGFSHAGMTAGCYFFSFMLKFYNLRKKLV